MRYGYGMHPYPGRSSPIWFLLVRLSLLFHFLVAGICLSRLGDCVTSDAKSSTVT